MLIIISSASFVAFAVRLLFSSAAFATSAVKLFLQLPTGGA
jgi:hypothetical protein